MYILAVVCDDPGLGVNVNRVLRDGSFNYGSIVSNGIHLLLLVKSMKWCSMFCGPGDEDCAMGMYLEPPLITTLMTGRLIRLSLTRLYKINLKGKSNHKNKFVLICRLSSPELTGKELELWGHWNCVNSKFYRSRQRVDFVGYHILPPILL